MKREKFAVFRSSSKRASLSCSELCLIPGVFAHFTFSRKLMQCFRTCRELDVELTYTGVPRSDTNTIVSSCEQNGQLLPLHPTQVIIVLCKVRAWLNCWIFAFLISPSQFDFSVALPETLEWS